MKLADYEAFCEIVGGFAELKGKQLSAAAIELYWRAMSAWDIDDFRAAAEHLLRTCEFMPVPSDFEKLRRASSRDSVTEAWNFACKHAVSRNGQPPSGGIDGYPVIDQCVRAIGGLQAIWACEADKLHFLERQFAERYAELLDVTEVREALPELDARPRIWTGGPKHIGELLPNPE
jgi:hypothetical protein